MSQVFGKCCWFKNDGGVLGEEEGRISPFWVVAALKGGGRAYVNEGAENGTMATPTGRNDGRRSNLIFVEGRVKITSLGVKL